MPIQLLGTGGAVVDVEGSAYRATETTMRPTDHGFLGAYRLDALRNDLIIAPDRPAGSFYFSFYWKDPTRICVVTKCTFNGMAGGPIAFTPGIAFFELLVARQWTTDTSGGSNMIPNLGLQLDGGMMRTTMNSTMVTGVRVAGGANLNVGTWILDAQPIGQCIGAVGATAGTQWIPRTDLYTATPSDGPLTLHTNEGLLLRGTVPATGNWRFGVTVSWYELTAF